MNTVVELVIENFREFTGKKFVGILYPVIMLVNDKYTGEVVPKVLEINVRDCDPGAQAKLPRLESDILDISMAVINKELDDIEITFKNEYSVAVCAVSGALRGREGLKPGYPADHYTNQPITGIEDALKEGLIYANGISSDYTTTGGRVLTAVGKGKTLEEAREKAYSTISKINFPGMRYRKTIGLDLD
ncbi:MAG: phosphoribosylglycinamide synthetase C domain-containing protein [Candidatus Aenigmarchaeota archaeon]|nr:hypothetical protein [Candidatus Aenigmarchaeota archaeon]MDW8160373.1 phosphoribosylglycinamide synthetase C domain-containing protein [Candidatus Aenigmarchaeota archaeon]